MKYVTLEDYRTFYTEQIEQADFNRYVISACQKADVLTTGIDGVHKLKEAFPTDSDDVEVVKASICGVIHLMDEVDRYNNMIKESQGYAMTEDGLIVGKTVSSISSGSESISYSNNASGISQASAIAKDRKAQEEAYKIILTEGFRGVKDKNGVNLLYMGYYPIDLLEVTDV